MLGYVAQLCSSSADGAALTNTTTGASLLPSNERYPVPAGWLRLIGQQVRVTAHGRISTVVTTPGTLTFELRMGPTSNIIACNSGALALNIVAKTNVSWYLEWLLTLRAAGTVTSANFMHTGLWTSEAVIGSALPTVGGSGSLLLPASAPAVGTGWDSTIVNYFDLRAAWSVANAANSIQCHGFSLELLN